MPVHSLKHFVPGHGQGAKRVSEERLREYLRARERGLSPPPRVFTHTWK